MSPHIVPPQKSEAPGDIARRAVVALDAGRTQEGAALAMAALTLQLSESGYTLRGLAGMLDETRPVHEGLTKALRDFPREFPRR
ncbi:hypothetical protein [Frankia sp. CcI49]|uniref:hypothetical protein n=1 Tax=Frankia sp. CcI49 TaxID=1745382 RepID=UPI0010549A9A|nr:hypothetical protein [Frankia sp. CcI49]